MATRTKEVAEKIGAKERDIDIAITRQNIWETTSAASTTWSENKIIEKDE
jgi:hypothetical protein